MTTLSLMTSNVSFSEFLLYYGVHRFLIITQILGMDFHILDAASPKSVHSSNLIDMASVPNRASWQSFRLLHYTKARSPITQRTK
jgi:hypothetical protein